MANSHPVSARDVSVVHERSVQSGAGVTRYLEAGQPDAPVLLLLHDGAWGGASDVTWGECIPRLAEHYRVLAPDFFGFGGSDKVTYFDRSSYAPRISQLADLLATLGVTVPAHVVGSSFGGSVALRLLETPAFPIASITSIGGSGGLWKTDVMARELGRWDGSRDDLARVLEFLMERGDGFERHLTLRERWAREPGHYRSLASAGMPIPDSVRTAFTDAWPTSLAGAATPTLLVAGERDELFEPEWPDHIAAQLASATIARVDSRHSPNLDHPDELVDILLSFLGDVDRGIRPVE